MFRGQFFHSLWFQEGLKLLGLEAGLLVLFWLLYRFAGFLQHFPFGDALFVVGGVELMIGGYGMLRGDTDLAKGPKQRGPALAVQQTQGEAQDEFKRRMAYGVRLVICGFITILISVVIYLFNKAAGG